MTALQTKTIEIDIDVHCAIEARRTTFDQSENAILREVFSLPKVTDGTGGPLPPDRRQRRTGTYVITLLEERFEKGSLKEAYTSCLLKLTELDPQFLERLSGKTTKSRRIVAQKPRDLYFRTPELSKQFASRLTDQWWVDTNLSRQQCEQRLKTACDVAGLRFGSDLALDFPD